MSPLDATGSGCSCALATRGRAGPPRGGPPRARRPPSAPPAPAPLRRALETAEAIAAVHGLPVEVDEALTEMDVGEMEGLTAAEMRGRYGDFLRRWFSDGAGGLAMPGGESLQQVQDRAWAAVNSLRAPHPEGTVVAVSHHFT